MTPPGMNVVSRPVVLPSPIAFGRWASVAPFAAPWSGAAWGLSSYAPARVALADSATQTPWWILYSDVTQAQPAEAMMQAGGQGAELYMTAGTHGVVDAVAGGMFAAGGTSRPGRTVAYGPGTLGGGGGGDDDLLSKPIKGHVADCLRIAGIGVADEGYIEFLEQHAAEGLTVGEVVDLLHKADQIFQQFAYHVPLKMQIVGRIVTGKYAEGAIGKLNQILAGWNIGTDGHPIIVENPDGSTVKGVNMSPEEIADIAQMLLPEGIGDQSLSVLMGSLAETRPGLTFREAAAELAPVALELKNRYERARQIILYDYFQGRRSAEELNELAAAMDSGHFQIWYLDDGQQFEARDRWLEWAKRVTDAPGRYSRDWIRHALTYQALGVGVRSSMANTPDFAREMDESRPTAYVDVGRDRPLGTMIHEANIYDGNDTVAYMAGARGYAIIDIERNLAGTWISLRPDGGSPPSMVQFNSPTMTVRIDGRHFFRTGDRVFIIKGRGSGWN